FARARPAGTGEESLFRKLITPPRAKRKAVREKRVPRVRFTPPLRFVQGPDYLLQGNQNECGMYVIYPTLVIRFPVWPRSVRPLPVDAELRRRNRCLAELFGPGNGVQPAK